MATFEYSALTVSQRLMKGIIEAGSPEEATQLLKQMQLKVNSLEKAIPERPKSPIARTEFLLFNQQLASLTKSGIPLEKGLRELSKDVASRPMRQLIDAIVRDLEAGVSIERAFEKRKEHFPPLYGRILKAGVETGRLSEMLTSLNRHLEISNQTRRIVFEALAYPAVIFVLASFVMTFVLLFLIPPFEAVLKEMTYGGLPGVTELIFALSRHVGLFWLVVGCIVAGTILINAVLRSSSEGRSIREAIMLRVPGFGWLYHSSILSKMAEAMAMMVAAGTDMPTCFRLGPDATGSEKLRREGTLIASEVEQGAGILDAGVFCRVIPRFFLYSIQLGSQRNELADNLRGLGDMYAQQVRSAQVRLQGLLLPIMIIFVGGFVMMCVIAMFLPMIKIITTLGG
ncbi:MAG: type II secretion system F family protein [Sedimentisphaerales bacterium]|nr:type II secretion system F family protein [Sedimentisphaerales bacterium]